MFNLVVIPDGEKEPIEVQTNLWSVVKDYTKDSNNYLLTNEEGTIIDSKGITKLLSFVAKEYKKHQYQRQECETLLRAW